ncbi:MAG: Gldg family protein [Kiritimatiellae bacterium]|nr:Gldg family protein [Kiritimatiellia bacterium]
MDKVGKRVASGVKPRRKALKATTLLAIALSVVFCFLVIIIGFWFDYSWEIPVGSVRVVSERTRDILADTQGRISITCFMDRRDPMARSVARLLRGLSSASRAVAGAEIDLVYVDPRWDVFRAAQLVARGVPENSLEFAYQRRKVVVALADMIVGDSSGSGGGNQGSVFRGERICASAISRLALPHRQLKIGWLQGHSEARFDDYDAFRGFSDIAHDLKRDGFVVEGLTLAGLREIPAEISVLVIAGARREMLASEIQLISGYLERGGCLLYLAANGVVTGCEPLLKSWGIEVTPYTAVSSQTLTGRDIVISSFSDHEITRKLNNASVVLGLTTCLMVDDLIGRDESVDLTRSLKLAESDANAWGELHPDSYPRRYDPLTELAGPVVVAAAAERGGLVSRDVAYKPTRICVIGDVDFVMNRALSGRANANRDFFMNAMGWLAGVSMGSSSSVGGDAMLTTGFTRSEWIFSMVCSVLLVPLGVLVLFGIVCVRKTSKEK